jgi:hypothetical protein
LIGNLLHLRFNDVLEDFFVEEVLELGCKGLFIHHVAFDSIVLVVDSFGDRVVGEVDLSVLEVFGGVGLGTKSNV